MVSARWAFYGADAAPYSLIFFSPIFLSSKKNRFRSGPAARRSPQPGVENSSGRTGADRGALAQAVRAVQSQSAAVHGLDSNGG